MNPTYEMGRVGSEHVDKRQAQSIQNQLSIPQCETESRHLVAIALVSAELTLIPCSASHARNTRGRLLERLTDAGGPRG